MDKPASSTVVIAGAGPAGLTAAHELASRSCGRFRPLVFEASEYLGGISRTVCYNGNRMDIGGHRFFTKSPRVARKWDEMLTMPRRRRVSRIYYLRKFFDYPVSLSVATLRAMGFSRTVKSGLGYLQARLRPLPETSLENFYINRFGRPLYRMFFEDYTEKVWGVHPSKIGADWGAQRVKGLSITAVVKDFLQRATGRRAKSAKVETSLIEEFLYPDLGPGQLWERMGDEVRRLGAELHMQTGVRKVHIGQDGAVEAVTVRGASGEEVRVPCSVFVSSMPLNELVASLDGIDVPEDVRQIASGLPYRDFISVGLLLKKMKLRNETPIPTPGKRIPDTWIYIQDSGVRLGRVQVFNNWSPGLVKDYENTIWLGLEYFCNEGDELWTMEDTPFIEMAVKELESIGMIDAADVIDSVRVKTRKAYPAYFGTYAGLGRVREFLDTIPNLYCIGRNGQHRYNNMDHSMLTAMEAADAILAGSSDRTAVWNVNTEEDYHETNQEAKD